jgi:hypothetical protein
MGELIENQEQDKKIAEVNNQVLREGVSKRVDVVLPTIGQVLDTMQGDKKRVEETLKEPAPKKTRSKTKVQGKATGSVTDIVSKLKERVIILEYIDSIKVPDVPTGVSKEGRDFMLNIGKSLDEVKSKLVTQISK